LELPDNYFITGIGTGIGKTLVSAILTEAFHADYWKPVQAGIENGTDSEWVQSVISNTVSQVHPESYKLKKAASPHIAAREETVSIRTDKIRTDFETIRNRTSNRLIIEGAGGMLVPLNEQEFVIDLIKKLDCRVILVSRHYLGSINHSLLTAGLCRSHDIPVAGWIFNDQFMDYGEEIVSWSGFPSLGSVPRLEKTGKENISACAEQIKSRLIKL